MSLVVVAEPSQPLEHEVPLVQQLEQSSLHLVLMVEALDHGAKVRSVFAEEVQHLSHRRHVSIEDVVQRQVGAAAVAPNRAHRAVAVNPHLSRGAVTSHGAHEGVGGRESGREGEERRRAQP